MLKEFREFAVKGNVIDLAIGVVIGAAFGKIISSFVSDLLMPPVGLLLGKVDFSNLFINLSSKPAETLAEAKKAAIPTLNYGVFLNTTIDFLIVAFAIFLVVKQVNRLKREPAPVPQEPTTKDCPQCCTPVPIKAIRCPHCTSVIG